MKMEQAVLGTVMQNPEFVDLFLERLPVESFSCTGTKVIANAISYLATEGLPFTNTAVLEQLRQHNALSLGANMLTDCWEQSRFVSDPEQTIASLGNLFALDEARTISNRLYHGATNMDLTSWLTLAEEEILRLRRVEQGAQPLQPVFLTETLTGEDLSVEWCVPSLLPAGSATMLTAEEGVGKALRLPTPIPTPSGWTTMGAIRVGDTVFSSTGAKCRVTAATKPYLPGAMYRVEFSDGATLYADADHQWATQNYLERARQSRRGGDHSGVRTTKEIAGSMNHIGRTNHSIVVCGPLDLPLADLPVEPYTLGVWLGDGTTDSAAITVAERDIEIMEGVAAEGYDWHWNKPENENCRRAWVSGLMARLREAGTLGVKHIPTVYLRASQGQRMALLAGLMDTDGYCTSSSGGSGRGRGASIHELCFTDETLARGAFELILSLGVKASMTPSKASYTLDGEQHITGTRWRISFQTEFNPYRHAGFKRDRWEPLRTPRATRRFIVGCEEIEPEMVRCIQVDSPDSTYLAGKEFIPTHNSTVLRQIAVSAMAGMNPFTPWGQKFKPQRVVLIDCEVSANQFKRSLRNLWSYGREFQPLADTDFMAVETHQGGLNFSEPHDQGWLHRLVRQHKADLLVVGPVYRFTDADLNTEEGVRTWQRCFEPMLADGVSILTEHHAGNGAAGQQRSLRPIGSSAMRRWFAQGISLRTDKCDPHGLSFCPSCQRRARVESWRGSREEEARWPHYLKGEKDRVWWTSDEGREVSVN